MTGQVDPTASAAASAFPAHVSEYVIEGLPAYRGSDDIRIARSKLDARVVWAVRHQGNCLNKQGEWEYEPQPSSRDEAFFARCRFDSAEAAIQAAQAVVGPMRAEREQAVRDLEAQRSRRA